MFKKAEHLPSRGFTDPHAHLPRQRRGVTPQLHGRYPDYDVLEEADHWDDETRRVVLARVDAVPPFRFFDEQERHTLKALSDTLLAQDAEPRIPVLSFVDEKLYENTGDGYQYFDMPSDREIWRRVAQGLDDEARALGLEAFAELSEHHRNLICHRFAKAELVGGVWATLNVSRAFSTVMRDICQAFYSHPWSWNEIGFGGPAYPRGYAAFGNPELGEREHWEGEEAFARDPVQDTKRRGMD
jgi:Gluconate 2-dehydrogenase subunit 3